MTPRTPSERIVLFPEPLRESHPRRRVAAVLFLCGALGVAGWFLRGDPVVREVTGNAAALVRDTNAKAIVQSAVQGAVQGAVQSAVQSAAQRLPAAASAPTGLAMVDSGVDAFESATYDTAATLLRRALRGRGADSLDDQQRVRALTFLGAAELERGNRDSSAAVFRRLLVANPNRPPNPQIFSTAVTSFYDGLRSKQKGVARIASMPDGVALTVVALTPHQVSVGIGQNGRPTSFQLFQGVVRDSIVVKWNGRSPQGAALQPGAYEFVLVATPSDGTPSRSVRFPILLERESVTGTLHARAPGAPAPVERSGGNAGEFLP